MTQFSHFFSDDSAKAIKARKLGWLNAINYMAPAAIAGVGNLCPHSSGACRDLCLGKEAGNVKLYSSVMVSRIAKAQLFMSDRKAFAHEMVCAIKRAKGKARRMRMRLCVRLNGSSDIGWEGVRVVVDGREYRNAFEAFPRIQFVDYTKNPFRMRRWLRGEFPTNYHLTFSFSGENEELCSEILEAGGTVAVAFAGAFPGTWRGFPVIDGDKSDLRHLDSRGVVVGLSPKGARAKSDRSGFVVRDAA